MSPATTASASTAQIKKRQPKKEVAPQPEPVVEATGTQQEETPVVTVPETQEKVKALLEYASNLTKMVKTLESEIKQLQQTYLKEQKQSKKKKKRTRAPSDKKHGFLGTSAISADLSSFLGLKKDEKVSRPDVTKAISKYVKEKELFTEKKSIFKPDQKLLKILGEPAFPISKKEPSVLGYSYFNLQSYLKKMNHFIKA